MSGLIFHLGRRLGYVTIPALRKTRQVWRSLAGTEDESIRRETEFGQAMAAELRLKTGVVNEESDAASLQEISRRLSARVRNKARQFRVEILRHSPPAALALPGGFIFVTPALLDACGRQADELAFLIGHEMGHVVRGHTMERLADRIGSEGLSSLVSRGLIRPDLRDSDLGWLDKAYAPEAEFEADEFAVHVAQAADYDANAALRWLDRLRSWRDSSSLTGNYLATHPPESERVAHIQSVLESSAGYRRP